MVAVTPSGVIGDRGAMPWRLSSDLRRFKRMTMGCPLIMGRRTYESIGRPLPGRTTIVLTRRGGSGLPEEVRTVDSVEAARREVAGARRALVVGGAEIYRQLIPACDQLWVTCVWSQAAGDTRLDPLPLEAFRLATVERIPAGARDSVPTEFQVWQRIEKGSTEEGTRNTEHGTRTRGEGS